MLLRDADYWTEVQKDPNHFTLKLSNARAYSSGPGFFGPSDPDLLKLILNPECDGFSGVVIRDSTGTMIGLCEGISIEVFHNRKFRINHILQTFSPTNQVGIEALRCALRRYGVNRIVPDILHKR